MWKGKETGLPEKARTGTRGRAPLFFVLFALALCLRSAHAQAIQEPLLSQATSISSRLRSALQDSQNYLSELEARSTSLLERLEESEILRGLQEEELAALSESLTSTTNSFAALSLELQNSIISYHRERVMRQTRDRVIAAFAAAFVAMVIGKVSVFALSARGARVPKWLKIIV